MVPLVNHDPSICFPAPVVHEIVKTADPSTLFKLSSTCKYFRQIVYKTRGLTIDNLIVTKEPTKAPLMSRIQTARVPRLIYTDSDDNPYKVKGVILVVDLGDAKSVRLLQNVQIFKVVILEEIDSEDFPEATLFQINENCELKTINCRFGFEAWETLLDLNWAGFYCKSKKFTPPPNLVSRKLTKIQKIDISLNMFGIDEASFLTEWRHEKLLKQVVFRHFSALLPKNLVEFIEERLDVNATVQIFYHSSVPKSEIDNFHKNLVKWMNKIGGDWMMIGHKGRKQKLLIKIGNGSGNPDFEQQFSKYVNLHKNCSKTVTIKKVINNMLKITS